MDRGISGVESVVTMFYYRDIDAAALWYETKLGFRRLFHTRDFVLFEISGIAQLALVAAGRGSQTPIEGPNKGAILSIQTSDLEGWRARLSAARVDGAGLGVVVGAGGRTVEFKVFDPEGYTVEFFTWIQ